MAVDSERACLYMNVLIIDATEAVKQKVKQTIKNSDLPRPIKSLAKRAAPKLISNWMTPSKLIRRAGEKLCRKVPAKMKERGVTAVAHEVFRQGPYVVVQLQIQHVDVVQMAKSQDFSDLQVQDGVDVKGSRVLCLLVVFIQWFFGMIGVHWQRSIESDYLPGLVQSKLDIIMGEMLEDKMEKKKIEVETVVLREDKQARYFYAKLAQLRERKHKGDGGKKKATKAPMVCDDDSDSSCYYSSSSLCSTSTDDDNDVEGKKDH